jgi:hypothetical protein
MNCMKDEEMGRLCVSGLTVGGNSARSVECC